MLSKTQQTSKVDSFYLVHFFLNYCGVPLTRIIEFTELSHWSAERIANDFRRFSFLWHNLKRNKILKICTDKEDQLKQVPQTTDALILNILKYTENKGFTSTLPFGIDCEKVQRTSWNLRVRSIDAIPE